ncbi:Hypothetical protein BCD_1271 (plasmid) [Borrelia crocidurae DOU]|uniref:Uncharacterized protein n=1 Tax=Borrelia crocidurae DOU TaxID=1293575 RepID=W5SK91_9SPIR|nr:DUF685 domain-containing protein [Borrelia crocidurae]AHH07337.1 Hypothetical protein BCD_1271 [Borrelia crocidurae DOU]
MENEQDNTEESIQIKDFNRKITVNENDLIPIDDIVEETYAITYKNLLIQIQKDTFYRGIEYFKQVIREIISKELLEYESHVDKMYIKTISKLIGLKNETNKITLDDVLKKIKEILIQNINQAGDNINSSKISIYNPQRQDFELIRFQTFIDKLKQIFAEITNLNNLKNQTDNILAQIKQITSITNNINTSYLKNYELESKLKSIIPEMPEYKYPNMELEFLAFHPTNKQLYRLGIEYRYLKGIPNDFQYWNIQPTHDAYYTLKEFYDKLLKIEITGEKVELRFPRHYKEQNIYLQIMLALTRDKYPNNTMTKIIYLRFSENSNASQYNIIYSYTGKQHNTTITLLDGWYKLKSYIYNNDTNQDVPHLLKL